MPTDIYTTPLIDKAFFNSVDTSIWGPPEYPGVYAVCVSATPSSIERIVYIGSSSNMKRRMLSATHPYIKLFRKLSDYCVYTRCHICEDFLDLERKLIGVYKPLLNKHWKNG